MAEVIKKPEIVHLENYEAFTDYVSNLDANGPTALFYFTGSKTENGKSWCPDCNDAEPVVKRYLENLQQHIIFGIVDVGDRDYWKNKECPFRTDKNTRLLVVPTLIKWKGVQRLEGSQCEKSELLDMLLDDD